MAELTEGKPAAVALANARHKARASARRSEPEEIVLGADTVVALDGTIYDQPPDAAAARATLSALAGRTHEVFGGVCVLAGEEAREVVAITRVTFRTLSASVIESYLSAGEWRGRAGAYAIQGRGAALVTRIDGDYTNVVGLPVATLIDLLPELLTA